MPWHHKYIGTPVLSAVVNLFFRAGVGDINCGLRGFTKHLANRLDFRTTGMEFASESLIKAAKLGVRLTEVPITLWPDKRGRPPHLRSFHDGWRHLRFMLLFAPNWLVLLPGAFCLLWKWAASDFGHFNDLRSVVFFSLWFFIGVQMIFSSFFLSMLGISRGTYIGDYDKDR